MLNIAEKAPSDFVQIANFRQGIGRDPLKTTAAGAVLGGPGGGINPPA